MTEDAARSRGDVVASQRLARGLTQRDLARKAGCQVWAVRAIELGEPGTPEELVAIEDALELPCGALEDLEAGPRPAIPPLDAGELTEAVRAMRASRDRLDSEVHGQLLCGDALAALRVRDRLAIVDVAQRAGISPKRLSALEDGAYATSAEIVALARALSVPALGLAALPPGRARQVERIQRSHRGQALLPGFPGATSWASLTWREDLTAQAFVAEHPEGAECGEIAAAIGVSCRQVERYLNAALRRVAQILEERS